MHLSSQNVNLSMLQDPQPFWLGVFFMYINIFDHIFTTYCFTSTHAHYFLQYGHSIGRVTLHRNEGFINDSALGKSICPWRGKI